MDFQESPLRSRTIRASLKADWKTPVLNERLIIFCNGNIIADNISLTILELNPSIPTELPGFRSHAIFVISD